MEKEKQKKIVSRVIVFAIALTMLIPVSAVLASAPGMNSTVVYVEYKDSATLQTMMNNGAELLVDYNNGFALMKMPAAMGNTLRSAGMYVDNMPERTVVKLDSGVSFDTSSGAPNVPAAFSKTYSSDEVGTYIVKCVGPMKGEWTQELKDMGVSVEHNIAKFAYVVRMDGALKDRVSQLPFVSWVGVYQPYYKVPTKAFDMDMPYLSATLYNGANLDAVVNSIINAGGTVLQVEDNANTPDIVTFTAPQSALSAIAGIDDIYMLYLESPAKPMDLVADDIHGAKDLWYPSLSGVPKVIDGSTQIVGIQDTGFDRGNQDPPGIMDLFNPTDRVVRYKDQGGKSDPDGYNAANGEHVAHGTHCVGLVAANGYSGELQDGTSVTDTNYEAQGTGMAPKAQMSLDGVISSGSGQGGDSFSPSTSYWDDEIGDGAKTMSNSWGSGAGSYDSTSQNVDDRIHGDPSLMILFAAGNDGPDPNTISANSLAKDGITVGASENYRPDYFGADNPNLVADFSSRGGANTSSGRIKPDLLAVGTADISLMGYGEWTGIVDNADTDQNVPDPSYLMDYDQYDSGSSSNPATGQDGINDYRYMQGTSMATPTAAGAYALVRDYFNKIEGNTDVSSPLAKAVLINGADRMDPDLYDYPGYDQGWGRINLKNSLYPDAPRTWQYTETSISSTTTWDITSTLNTNIVKDDVPLKVTLTWVDSSGDSLSNDLNLRVVSPSGTEYHGDMYTNGWSTPNPSGYDSLNNVEQVEVETPEPGTWTIQVLVANQPETFPAAVVISGDFGPTEAYDVSMSTDYPTSFSMVAGGHATFPFSVLNFGTNSDSIALGTSGMPTGLSVSFSPDSPLSLDSQESVDDVATFTASSSMAVGVYDFYLTATSNNDPNSPPASDSIPIRIEILDQPLPKTYRVTNGTVDEQDPSVVTFNDGSTNWIFIGYRKTTPDGVHVWEAHTTLDANGNPVEPWTYNEVSNVSDYPNDIRLGVIPGSDSSHPYRVYMSWTGYDPAHPYDGKGNPGSWGRFAYADPSDYSSWTVVTIDENFGEQTYNNKRVSFALYAMNTTSNTPTLVYVFEHLDSDSNGQLKGVDTGATTSTDGGATWSSAAEITPGDGNYYFFPNGCVDQNGVAWVFFYWRTPSGNDRDLCVTVWDGAWGGDSSSGSKATDVWDTTDNVQFPAAVSTSEGSAGNRVYFVVTRDQNVQLQMYTGYYDGDVSSSSPPPDSSNGWGTTQGPFGSDVSDANYNRRPVLVMVATDNGYAWLPYIENDNPYNAGNMWTIYSDDAFSTTTTTKVTADAYPKGHDMADTLTIGTTDNMYEVYHSSHGTITDVNYDVYLTIYHIGWETEADNNGPVTSQVAANPNPFNLSVDSSFDLTANIQDAEMSGIAAAQYLESPTEPTDWSGAHSMTLSGSSSSEVASATVTPSGWSAGDTHTFWVRGQDSEGNWGDPSSVTVSVVGSAPSFDIPVHAGWNLISYPILASGDIETVLTDSNGNVEWDNAQWYNPLDSGDHWKTHVVGRAVNDLNTIDNTMAIWLHVTNVGDGYLTVSAGAPTSTAIQLHAGWNLVSYPASSSVAMDSAGLPASVTKIAQYDSGATYLVSEVSDWAANNFVPGNGYWLYSTADTTWTVGY